MHPLLALTFVLVPPAAAFLLVREVRLILGHLISPPIRRPTHRRHSG